MINRLCCVFRSVIVDFGLEKLDARSYNRYSRKESGSMSRTMMISNEGSKRMCCMADSCMGMMSMEPMIR